MYLPNSYGTELASGTYQDLTTPLGQLLNLPGFLPLAMTKAFRKDPHFNLCLGLLGPVPLASNCGTPRLILSPTMLQILPAPWLVENLDLRKIIISKARICRDGLCCEGWAG